MHFLGYSLINLSDSAKVERETSSPIKLKNDSSHLKTFVMISSQNS